MTSSNSKRLSSSSSSASALFKKNTPLSPSALAEKATQSSEAKRVVPAGHSTGRAVSSSYTALPYASSDPVDAKYLKDLHKMYATLAENIMSGNQANKRSKKPLSSSTAITDGIKTLGKAKTKTRIAKRNGLTDNEEKRVNSIRKAASFLGAPQPSASGNMRYSPPSSQFYGDAADAQFSSSAFGGYTAGDLGIDRRINSITDTTRTDEKTESERANRRPQEASLSFSERGLTNGLTDELNLSVCQSVGPLVTDADINLESNPVSFPHSNPYSFQPSTEPSSYSYRNGSNPTGTISGIVSSGRDKSSYSSSDVFRESTHGERGNGASRLSESSLHFNSYHSEGTPRSGMLQRPLPEQTQANAYS